MSIAAMAYVWEHSTLQGSELLLLLAVADFANQDGIAWPGINTLAKRIRRDPRTAQRCLKRVVASGEMRLQPAAGPHGAHRYQILMNRTLPMLFDHEGGGETPPGNLPGVTSEPKRGDIAVSPEPSGSVIKKKERGRAKEPTPVSLAFRVYKDGIKKRYGAEYPPSAKANGQLSNVISRVGAESIEALVTYYLNSQNTFYPTRKHSLEILVRDCERLYLDMQMVAGGAARPSATHADVFLLKDDGAAPKRLQQYPVGNPKEIATQAVRDYGRMVATTAPRYVDVVLAGARSRFSIEELR